MEIKRMLTQAGGQADEDVLGRILSNRIDFGNEDGGLVSSKQFDRLIADIRAWRAWANARDAQQGGPSTNS
jgi:hypothetical protein